MRGDEERQAQRQAQRQAEALDRAWDALVRPRPAPTPSAATPAPDPALLDAVRDLHDRNDALDPDPTFLRTLREDLMQTHPAAKSPTPFSPSFAPTANGHAPAAWLPPRPAPRPARPRPWARAVELAAVAALILAILGGTLAGSGSLPAFLALWQGDGPDPEAGVPMLGANPGRTGEQPGPGPEDVPGARWRAFVNGGALSPTVVDGVVYVAADAGELAAFDAETGDERWRAPLRAGASPPTVADGIAYVGLYVDSEGPDSTGVVRAFDAATGREVWSASTGRVGGASPVVVDGVVYAVGDAEVFAFDAATGVEQWHHVLPAGACGCTNPSVAVAGSVVYAVGGDDLSALDAATGKEQWRFETEGSRLTAPVVAEGRVYVGSGVANEGAAVGNGAPITPGALHAVDARTGERRWTQVAVELMDAPAVVDGVVYVPTGGSFPGDSVLEEGSLIATELVAFDAETGDPRWRVDLPSAGFSPAVADGVVYVAGKWDEGYVAAFDAASGEERWRLNLRGSVVASPAVVDGTVYITNYHGGAVFALDEATATATPSADGSTLLGEPCEAVLPTTSGRTLTGTPVVAAADIARAVEFPIADDDLPTGAPASAAAGVGIKETVEGLARCGDADPEFRVGFYSDDFFRRFFAEVEGDVTAEDAAATDGWDVSPFAEIVVSNARELPDGRVGAVIEGGFNRSFIVFVEAGNRWLIDEVILPIEDEGGGAGTPEPSGTPAA